MRRLSLVVGIVAVSALACSDPTSLSPTAPSPPGVQRLELTGPISIAPGQSVQLVATIRLADGTGKLPSLSTPMQWFSSNTSVLRVSSTGLATGQQPGDATITVVYGSGSGQRQSSKVFIVVPEGTYRVGGTISEAGFPSVPISGALVAVTPGSLVAVTNLSGQFTLWGVPPDAVVTVSKTGYLTLTQGIQLTSHATLNFSLTLSGPRFMIAGPYTVTIDLSGSCISNQPLPAALQQRTYEAVITQNGPEVFVALTETRFRTSSFGKGNKFTGRATTDEVTFFLDPFDPYYYYYDSNYYPSIAERLSDNTILIPQGTFRTTGSGGLSGSMPGSISRWDSRFPAFNTNVLSYCDSAAMKLTLTPR